MAIRPATYDPTDPTGGPDVSLIMRLVALVPDPPLVTPRTIGRVIRLASQIVLIDDVQKTVCRASPRSRIEVVEIPWWMWDGRGNYNARLRPVLWAVVQEVLNRHPLSGPWPVYGDFHGAGDTDAKKLADSDVKARAVKAAIGGGAVVLSPENPNMKRMQWTVAEILAAKLVATP